MKSHSITFVRRSAPYAVAALAIALGLLALALNGDDTARQPELERIVQELNLKGGECVAHIGWAGGDFLLGIAQAVGEKGKVTVVGADDQVLDAAREKLGPDEAARIQSVPGGPASANLESGRMDAIVVSLSLQSLVADRSRQLVTKVADWLKPGGRAFVMGLKESGTTAAFKQEQASARNQLTGIAAAAGLTLDAEYHYPRDRCFLRFRKAEDWQAREQMVELLRREGMLETGPVIKAMRSTPRHLFVPEKLYDFAYVDTPLPIGEDQTISAPGIVAKMTELLEPKPGDTVLEVGTGSGYQAAVLAGLVKHVYTIEIVSSLAESARERLKHLGYGNVTVRCGDGYRGWTEHAPFDGIIVTCAPEKIPQPLKVQLKEGGHMVIPVGRTGGVQELYQLEKRDGTIKETAVLPVRFVPMTGEAEKQ